MMKFLILTILFLNLGHASAQTQEISKQPHYDVDWYTVEPVSVITADSIKLVGSMVEDRKTHDLFGFHCIREANPTIEPTCKKVRPIYFSKMHEQLIAFGPVYIIQSVDPEKPTDEEISRAMSDMGKDFSKHWKRVTDQGTRNFKLGMISLPVLWMGVPAVHAMIFTGGVIACPIICPWILVGSAVWVPTMIFLGVRDGVFFRTKGVVGSTISNNEGWDWAVRTKKIKTDKFKNLVQFFDSQMNTVNGFNDNELPAKEYSLNQFLKSL